LSATGTPENVMICVAMISLSSAKGGSLAPNGFGANLN